MSHWNCILCQINYEMTDIQFLTQSSDEIPHFPKKRNSLKSNDKTSYFTKIGFQSAKSKPNIKCTMDGDRAANQRSVFLLSFTLALYISNGFEIRIFGSLK